MTSAPTTCARSLGEIVFNVSFDNLSFLLMTPTGDLNSTNGRRRHVTNNLLRQCDHVYDINRYRYA
jgi:hypothetical protein